MTTTEMNKKLYGAARRAHLNRLAREAESMIASGLRNAAAIATVVARSPYGIMWGEVQIVLGLREEDLVWQDA